MKTLQSGWLFCTALFFLCSVSVSNAATIVTGQLTYDSDTSIITSSTGVSYLGFEIADGYNYDYVLNIILTNPLYSDYHIATQAEAYEFYNLAIDPTTSVVDTAADQSFNTAVAGIRDRFGPSAFRNYGYGDFAPALFLSDDGITDIGFVRSYDGAVVITDNWGNLPSTYYYTYGNGHEDLYSWLIVNNSSVPEPGTGLLTGFGLVWLAAQRRVRSEKT